MTKQKALILTFLLTFFSSLLWAQTPYNKETLQKRSQKLKQEIADLNNQLAKSKNESKTSILYISNLKKKISARTQLVNTTQREARFIDDEIYLRQLDINQLKRELAELRRNYAGVLVSAYKNKSLQNKILFILSADDVAQAYRRIKYLQKYSDFQNRKTKEIKDKQAKIENTIKLREAAKREKISNLEQQKTQLTQLDSERKEKQIVVDKYIKEQGDLASKIKQRQIASRELDRQISKIIAEEIRLAREKAAKEKAERERAERERIQKEKADAEALAKNTKATRKERKAATSNVASSPTKSGSATKAKELPKSFESRAETSSMSKKFEANKKSLPWPLDRGSIITRFGPSPHPILEHITVDCPGVEIATSSGSLAKAVFDGEVTAVMSIPGGNKAVIINHGDYFTVYTNLETVIISKGDKIREHQALGKIYTDDTGNTVLGFQVWKGNVKQNPANWIAGM